MLEKLRSWTSRLAPFTASVPPPAAAFAAEATESLIAAYVSLNAYAPGLDQR